MIIEEAPLGKKTPYIETYSPELLYPIPRSLARDKVGLRDDALPFHGVDIWSGFEFSWLNPKGKPQIAMLDMHFPCNSTLIVESKSLKLYFNSFNQSTFSSLEEVCALIKKDISAVIQNPLDIHMYSTPLSDFPGESLDHLDIETSTYKVCPDFLKTSDKVVDEELYSDLLKSNCLATGQPDWGSVYIHYKGSKIDREGLLKYIISYRSHSGFAEHCTEQMYADIMERCKPTHLTVYTRFTRRGGLDINPFRSNFETAPKNVRLPRQ